MHGEVTITDLKEDAIGETIIPTALAGYPVTAIDDYAFSGCRNLESITIPERYPLYPEG